MKITEISSSHSNCKGGKKLILVAKKMISCEGLKVHFCVNGIMKEANDVVVHNNCAVVLKTPSFDDLNLMQTTKCLIYISKEEFGEVEFSESMEFWIKPQSSGHGKRIHTKTKCEVDNDDSTSMFKCTLNIVQYKL